MRNLVVIFAAISLSAAAAPPNSSDPYAPLWLYAGTWQVTRKDSPKPDTLIDECQKIGRFFACEQTVNGTPGALIIFIPVPNKPGHYYTQNVRPEGRASSRGDLEINGDHWIYSSNWDEGGSSTFYRTTNVFTGHNRIHFEQAESHDNKEWTVKMTGDEVRTSAGRH